MSMQRFQLRRRLLGAFLALGLTPWLHAADNFDAGIDYTVIENATPYTGEGVQVQEFFWYGCPHCYKFEPYLKDWLAEAPEGVKFERIPAPLNRHWVIHTRAYYAAQRQNVAEKGHQALFDAIHKDNKNIADRNSLAAFYASQGADAGQFKSDLGSFGVDTQMRKAALLSRRYQISGVPSVVINGQYLASPHLAGGSNERLIKIVDHLVKKALAEK